MNRVSLAALTFCSMLAFAPSVRAQVADAHRASIQTRSTANVVLSARQAGISRTDLVEHSRQAESLPANAATVLSQARARRGMPLMIVGGAAFLAGLIIGDDVGTAIAVGGAAVGIYGLYLWAQTQ